MYRKVASETNNEKRTFEELKKAIRKMPQKKGKNNEKRTFEELKKAIRKMPRKKGKKKKKSKKKEETNVRTIISEYGRYCIVC